MFKVDSNKPFNGPHQKHQPQTHGASVDEAEAAVILVHGRGATPESMFPLADELGQSNVHYVALQADNHTWYPYSFLAPTDKNQPGISSGLQLIHDTIHELDEGGIPFDQIMLLGFSQGACLSTEFVARHPQKMGGVVAYSGGLIGPEVDTKKYDGSVENTPVFLGCSDSDPHIPKERVDETEAVFEKLNARVTKRIYPNMPHTVNEDEIDFVREMVDEMLAD